MYFIHGPSDGGRTRASVTRYRNAVYEKELIMKQDDMFAVTQFGLPLIGMTVFNDQELMYLYYKPSRNGGRGFYKERTIAHSFNSTLLTKHGMRTVLGELDSAPVVWQALKPKYATLADAWKDFQEGPDKLAYALTRVFGVHLSDTEHPKLCYRVHEIGDVLGPNKVRLLKKHSEYADPMRRVLDPKMEIEVDESR
jgi:hypothetical protein